MHSAHFSVGLQESPDFVRRTTGWYTAYVHYSSTFGLYFELGYPIFLIFYLRRSGIFVIHRACGWGRQLHRYISLRCVLGIMNTSLRMDLKLLKFASSKQMVKRMTRLIFDRQRSDSSRDPPWRGEYGGVKGEGTGRINKSRRTEGKKKEGTCPLPPLLGRGV